MLLYSIVFEDSAEWNDCDRRMVGEELMDSCERREYESIACMHMQKSHLKCIGPYNSVMCIYSATRHILNACIESCGILNNANLLWIHR